MLLSSLIWGCVNPDLLGDSDRPLEVENFEMQTGGLSSADSEIPSDSGYQGEPSEDAPLRVEVIDRTLHVNHDVYLPDDTTFDDIQIDFTESQITLQYAPMVGDLLFMLSYDINLETLEPGTYTFKAQEDSTSFTLD